MVAWAVTRRDVADKLMTHPQISKNARLHWGAYLEGRIPESYPLLQFVVSENMLTVDGEDHARLRQPMQRAFTARRVEALRPCVEGITKELLDQLDATPPGTVVDLREFAFELPVAVICELFGVEDLQIRRQLAVDSGLLLSSTASDAERLAAQHGVFATMAQLIEAKRAQPGDDLTTALIAEGDSGNLSEEELASTLFLTLVAGHETTRNLLSNAFRRLLQHPDQLARLLSGDGDADPWPTVIEECLRFDAPAATTVFYFAARDVQIEGVTIREGDPIMIYNAAIGRDDEAFVHPHVFLAHRADARQHRAFGHGAHHCIGAALARLEAHIALRALFERFTVTPAADFDALAQVPSLSSNAPIHVPVHLASRSALQ